MSAQLEISEINSHQALEDLCPEWCALWVGIADGSPFASPEWLLAGWWRFFGRGKFCVLGVRKRIAA